MKPKKSLGQNFLTSVPARIAIVKAGNVTKDETILEIGGGKGFLTEELLKTGAHILVLEKDRTLIPVLTEQFSSYKNFSLIEGDALLFQPKRYKQLADGYKLIANIPYYITGAILEHYLSNENQPSQMVVLVQKEVAERIVSKDKKESVLSNAVKVYGTPKIVYRVKRGSFNPIPNVDSAVLSIENISRERFLNKHHEETFFKVLKAGFAHKRKFLISNLKEGIPEKDWKKVFLDNIIPEKIRAEDLSLEKWLFLAK